MVVTIHWSYTHSFQIVIYCLMFLLLFLVKISLGIRINGKASMMDDCWMIHRNMQFISSCMRPSDKGNAYYTVFTLVTGTLVLFCESVVLIQHDTK